MLESEFQSESVKLLKQQGALVLNVHGHPMQASGWPDIFVAHWKFSGWIEFKVEKRKLSALQSVRVKELRKRGVKVRVVWLTDNQNIYIDFDAETEIKCTIKDWRFDIFDVIA